MTARAIFKTTIHLGELAVPVKLFSAVEDRRVHFRLLHAEDLQPVVQQMVNPRTGEPVPPEQVRRGYEAEPGKFVLLDEIEGLLEPEDDRRMEVMRVVPRAALPSFLDRAREVVREVEPGALVADFGHWGDGGVHCNVVLVGVDVVDPDLAHRLRDAVLGLTVHEFGGSFSAEHGVGPSNADWWRAATPEGVQRLTHQLKAVFDPLGVLGHPGLPY